MAQNMNKQLKAICQDIYETDGLRAVKDLVKEIQAWTKCIVEMEKRAAEQNKFEIAEDKTSAAIKKIVAKNAKALFKELRKNDKFKLSKKTIAEHEKKLKKAKKTI